MELMFEMFFSFRFLIIICPMETIHLYDICLWELTRLFCFMQFDILKPKDSAYEKC
jgi:hypothetical protein